MARTSGSGWGGGAMLWQKCKLCGKKKALYCHVLEKFKCTSCKQYFDDEALIRRLFPINKSEK